ncbi:hypothetical protein EAH75_07230 [Rhodanobacter glycinis]|uniref:hypothetical protein n=1 Tax=Rhodanobacter glycinis TaxID=582702 RepID=UPI001126B0D4|nr:hypothetical protein [Rhodanobacter glycinis]TPG51490.1 hypothetical protein EAH75_07230 [Rhodanobacter glycinis]
MHQRLFTATWVLLGIASICVEVHAGQKTLGNLLEGIQPLTQELPRYSYLVATIPLLPKADQPMGQQLLASSEAELGLYSEAVRDFPLRSRLPSDLVPPKAADWQAVDAVDAIVTLARDRRIVMVNEAHHDAHTRELTLALLPRLRAMGFTYFAAEALDEREASLMKRGYPVSQSGSEYLHEPLYGDIVREAIKLGFVIVPYDADGTPQEREDGEAENLYERVFARNPEAKLFVHAGYAHIDKQRGRLGPVKPMAMQLSKLSGIAPLSVDQTDIREENPRSEVLAYNVFKHALKKFETIQQPMLPRPGWGPGDVPERPSMDAYALIIAEFHPTRAIVLLHDSGRTPWSARPTVYDLSVILPQANSAPSDYTQGAIQLRIDNQRRPVMPPANGGHRPDWLSLDGQRVEVPVDTEFCARKFPCLVEAHYAAESAAAIPADRYLFLQDAKNVLYLRPGSYRLSTVDVDGDTLNEQDIQVANP